MKKICVFLSMLGGSFLGLFTYAEQQPYIDNLAETQRVFASLLNDDNYQIFMQMPEERRKQCIDMWQGYDETGGDTRPDAIVDKVRSQMEESE
ncbi:MAG: hypothetical protein K2Y01_09960 [Rhabdochlamydiaceae bacterium]|nr:hypothetical protein [Rhabdochlamydiaceae bacterium]